MNIKGMKVLCKLIINCINKWKSLRKYFASRTHQVSTASRIVMIFFPQVLIELNELVPQHFNHYAITTVVEPVSRHLLVDTFMGNAIHYMHVT